MIKNLKKQTPIIKKITEPKISYIVLWDFPPHFEGHILVQVKNSQNIINMDIMDILVAYIFNMILSKSWPDCKKVARNKEMHPRNLENYCNTKKVATDRKDIKMEHQGNFNLEVTGARILRILRSLKSSSILADLQFLKMFKRFMFSLSQISPYFL